MTVSGAACAVSISFFKLFFELGHLEGRTRLVLFGRLLIAEAALVQPLTQGGRTLVTDGKLALKQPSEVANRPKLTAPDAGRRTPELPIG